MEIRQLDPAVYAGRKFTASYRTKGYYDICAAEDGFRLRYVPLGAPMEKSFDDEFFGEWLEEPVAFGAFEGERLLGYVEGAPEGWNNRYRISNICIFEENARGKGLGTLLMQTIQRAAEAAGARDDRSGDADLQRKRDRVLQAERLLDHRVRPVFLLQRRPGAP